jgi:glycine cleavage system H protein
MTTKKKSLLPGDARPCVWMTAGVVAYKICDHDFDCDSCPLDAGLCGRETREAAPELEVESAARAEVFEFPADRFYHASHTWAQPFDQTRVRSGIDSFAAHLLSCASSVVLPAEGTVLQQGRVGFWISEQTRLIPLISPVTGRVLKRNQQVQKFPGLVAASPYGQGWLLEVDCPDWPSQRQRLVDADRLRKLVHRQMASFRKRVAGYVEHPDRAVGPTMADGGERLTDVRRILGPIRYRRLVLRYLR